MKIPFGYRIAPDAVVLEKHPEEQRAIALIQELRATGMSYGTIKSELQERGWRRRHTDRPLRAVDASADEPSADIHSDIIQQLQRLEQRLGMLAGAAPTLSHAQVCKRINTLELQVAHLVPQLVDAITQLAEDKS